MFSAFWLNAGATHSPSATVAMAKIKPNCDRINSSFLVLMPLALITVSSLPEASWLREIRPPIKTASGISSYARAGICIKTYCPNFAPL